VNLYILYNNIYFCRRRFDRLKISILFYHLIYLYIYLCIYIYIYTHIHSNNSQVPIYTYNIYTYLLSFELSAEFLYQMYCTDVISTDISADINLTFCPIQQSHDNHKSIYLEDNWRLDVSSSRDRSLVA